MTTKPSPVRADIDLEAPGKRVGHVRVPHSTHESAYGWIAVPIAVVPFAGQAEGAGLDRVEILAAQ